MNHVVKCPAPGRITTIHVKPGDPVEQHTIVITMESMERELPIEAEVTGIVSNVLAAEGSTHKKGDILVLVE